jgi:hypothetical protein
MNRNFYEMKDIENLKRDIVEYQKDAAAAQMLYEIEMADGNFEMANVYTNNRYYNSLTAIRFLQLLSYLENN